MLNRSWQLKVAWVALGGILILVWAAAIFTEAGTARILGGTAGMLLGVILISVNATALIEDVVHALEIGHEHEGVRHETAGR